MQQQSFLHIRCIYCCIAALSFVCWAPEGYLSICRFPCKQIKKKFWKIFELINYFIFQKQLNIAIVAPLAERVPAIKYGGAERIISYLTEELVRRGHNVRTNWKWKIFKFNQIFLKVTLFAPSTSVTSAHLITKW